MGKKKNTVEERLVKGYIKKRKGERKEYAISEINALKKDDLLEIKYQYESDLKTTISWTWVIAIYGAVFGFLSSSINKDSETNIALILFAVTVVGAGGIAIRLHYVLSAQKYLLCRVEERLSALAEEKKGHSASKEEYGEIIDVIRKQGMKEKDEMKERFVKKMLTDGVLSEKKIAEYAEMTVEQVRKYIR